MQGDIFEKLSYECGTTAKVVHNQDDADYLLLYKRCHSGNVPRQNHSGTSLSGIQLFPREILDSGLNPAGMTSVGGV